MAFISFSKDIFNLKYLIKTLEIVINNGYKYIRVLENKFAFLLARYKQFTKYEFDLMGFVRLLIYWKILKHPSKIATVNQNDNYYSDIIKVIYEYNFYATLNFLYDYKYNLIN